MISNRPYLIRAIFDWIVDNQWTPHVQVDANYPGVDVPKEYVQEGLIVLNMHPNAVVGLSMENDWLAFKARFQGIERSIGFPPEAVLAVFARENGQGMPFPPEPYPQSVATSSSKPTLSAVEGEVDGVSQKAIAKAPAKGKKPTLTVVK